MCILNPKNLTNESFIMMVQSATLLKLLLLLLLLNYDTKNIYY